MSLLSDGGTVVIRVVLRHVTPCSLVTGTKFRRNVSTRLHGVTSRNTVNAVTIAART
jgi:hypothetical protein